MTGSCISLREYGKLHVGELEPSRRSVTPEQAALLTKLKPLYGFDIFKWTNQHTLAAQQYVGTVQVGGLTIEILPKIEGVTGTPSDSTIRRNLIAMLMVALDMEIGEGEIAHIAVQRHGILEILIRLFCDKIFAQVRRGLVRRYERNEENLSVLRGRLALGKQLRLNAANPERLYCCFDEFHEDNPLNQILKAAISVLFKASKDLTNQRQLAELLLVFDGVSAIPVCSLPWHRVNFDRLNDRFRPSFRLAELFLRFTPPDVSSGEAVGFSLFFDMNSLFEEYIGRVARRTFSYQGIRVRLQSPQRFLAWEKLGGSHAFAMKPDVVGIKDDQAVWIIDTKWKQLSLQEAREGAAQSDLYQMYAYANNYECTNVVLLYPHHSALGDNVGLRASYKLNKWIGARDGSSGQIQIATVDLSDLKSVPNQLRALFVDQSESACPA